MKYERISWRSKYNSNCYNTNRDVAVGAVLIPRLVSKVTYTSCCTQAGGKWENGYCMANTPTTCEAREAMWKEYNSCVFNNGKNDVNQKYRAADCTN